MKQESHKVGSQTQLILRLDSPRVLIFTQISKPKGLKKIRPIIGPGGSDFSRFNLQQASAANHVIWGTALGGFFLPKWACTPRRSASLTSRGTVRHETAALKTIRLRTPLLLTLPAYLDGTCYLPVLPSMLGGGGPTCFFAPRASSTNFIAVLTAAGSCFYLCAMQHPPSITRKILICFGWFGLSLLVLVLHIPTSSPV